jgi:type 1 glutamine amidotransferase
MTGVFHFMAVSLGSILAARKLRLPTNAVNAHHRRRSLLPQTAGLRWLLVACATVGTAIHHSAAAETAYPHFAVLVFSKTAGFRHDSIPQGIAAITALGVEHGFTVDSTEDAARFTDASLARYRVVVFLNTTGDILDPNEKAVFERYIASGGGFAGIHSASDTEYRWPWYGKLVGAYFASHPAVQRATVRIADASHPSTMHLPQSWERTDEWYNFRSNPRGAVHVLATLDEASYSGSAMGSDHPIAWCQTFGGGRSWYTAMGHTAESYAEPLFQLHLLGGIESVTGLAQNCGQNNP